MQKVLNNCVNRPFLGDKQPIDKSPKKSMIEFRNSIVSLGDSSYYIY